MAISGQGLEFVLPETLFSRQTDTPAACTSAHLTWNPAFLWKKNACGMHHDATNYKNICIYIYIYMYISLARENTRQEVHVETLALIEHVEGQDKTRTTNNEREGPPVASPSRRVLLSDWCLPGVSKRACQRHAASQT